MTAETMSSVGQVSASTPKVSTRTKGANAK
jgi:hypothetical protein